jgi:hypothetical protein
MDRIGLPEVLIALLAVGLPYWAWRGFALTKRRSVYVGIAVFILFAVYQFTRTFTPTMPH